MKLPSPWHANAAVCALAFIKPVAVRQSSLCDQMRCDEIHPGPQQLHSSHGFRSVSGEEGYEPDRRRRKMISVRLTTRSSTTVLRLEDPDETPGSVEVSLSLSVSAPLLA